MARSNAPASRLVLVTPVMADAEAFATTLAAACAAADIAAVIVRLADGDERTQINRVKALVRVIDGRETALVVDGHPELVARAGADYVMFGEPDEGGHRPGFEAVLERVAWWAEIFESPCVAYAADRNEVEKLAEAGADFIALSDSIWSADPARALAEATAAIVPREHIA